MIPNGPIIQGTINVDTGNCKIIKANKIVNLDDPINPKDAANKEYVDNHTSFPGGLNTQVQYNDNGLFNGSSNMTFNKNTSTFTATTITDGVASLNNGLFTNLINALPNGGSTNTVLTKNSNADYDVSWQTAQSVSGVPLGGLTGQILNKATDSDLDTQWSYMGNASKFAGFGSSNILSSIDSWSIIGNNSASISVSDTYTGSVFPIFDINGNYDGLLNQTASFLNYSPSTNASTTLDNNSGFISLNLSPSINSGTVINGTNVGITGVFINPQVGENIFSYNGVSVFGYGTDYPDNITGFSCIPSFDGNVPVFTGLSVNYNNSSTVINNYQGITLGHSNNQEITNFIGLNIYSQSSGVNRENMQGVNISTNIDDIDYFAGINVNPSVQTSANGVAGIYSNTYNVGIRDSVVIQDLTYNSNRTGSTGITIEYVGGGIAGSEIVTVNGTYITVQIQDGVSTAFQIQSAIQSNISNNLVGVTVSGIGSDAQFIVAQTPLIGGSIPNNTFSGQFEGNVNINGRLNSFGEYLIQSDGTPFQPDSVTFLINSITCKPGTYSNMDLIGVNTAMLISVPDSTTLNSGPIGLGISALGLPAVVEIQGTSVVDVISGSTFALSLSGTATGGTISRLNLCRALGIPNGITTVDKLYAYSYDEIAGPIGTDKWGIYMNADSYNWTKGSLKIGGAAGTTDRVSNINTGLEIEDSHIYSKQITSPLISSPILGTTVSVTNATDTAGVINYETGPGPYSTGSQLSVSFNKTYATSPIVIITPANSVSGENNTKYYVSSNTSSFTISFQTIPSSNETYIWNYFVIGTI